MNATKKKKEIFLVKARRPTTSFPVISPDVVRRNFEKRTQTAIVLDLNVMADMERVLNGEWDYEDTGLPHLVQILNSVPALHLIPGFAIAEVAETHLESRINAFNQFLEKYCPTYIDSPNAINTALKRERVRSHAFDALGEVDRLVLSAHYLAMLQIRLIDRESDLRPYEKFAEYIAYMRDTADLVSPLEAEVAKYVFSNGLTIDEPEFRAFCSAIRANFCKKAKTQEELLKVSLNAARDLSYYWLSADLSAMELDGWRQDMWFCTGDIGTANLAQSIYYIAPPPTGLRYASTVGDVPYRDKYEYFTDCDELLHDLSSVRFKRGVLEREPKEILARLQACIDATQQEIARTWGAL